MEKNCKTCKFEHLIGVDEPCNTCNCTDNIRFGDLYSKWQPKRITYTRDEVFELMREAYDEGYSHEDNMSCKTMLDNYDKLKNQKL